MSITIAAFKDRDPFASELVAVYRTYTSSNKSSAAPSPRTSPRASRPHISPGCRGRGMPDRRAKM